jgi:F-type H+-transporting ATPase subunit delta
MSTFGLRYARAFEQVAAAQHLDRDAARKQLSDFAEMLHASRELHEFLVNPSLPHEQKLKVLDALSQRAGVERTVRNFIAVLMDHQRLDALDEVIAEYAAVADAAAGTSEVEIVSARALSDADKQELAAQASKLAGGNVRVQWKEDAALLGGAVVRIGSKVYDGSVRAQLGQLERHLAGAQ